ncbi:threonine dehydratase [Streptoalloteichus tenebrarius]|uniref:Threonine dehydratase n=1 Tax=Streptoalloteichus tenebrarius (strain ATCC 17920 / DSM 40477 / JCM 4838 / CBS 697.72 / NBRC 16177 / NCIMB 11028 / NRRL B-12390 / A12253. 1 / ISP 5477) TaxID=1933 RepID=A0ABT1HYZ1_STRSD|nr:pyridoxal-phosphate dependent enzyme [Streptoalloteichus tenebrarius]MCP2260751.1 threonine dehydratase [Streptoalloteichus tenebrarius]BFF03436.1 pyridoxal-phosphate dependent enzyme [Streptoalloteichus tenebrarius]
MSKSVPALSPEHIERAAREIDPVFRNTPQFTDGHLNAALGREVVVKVETVNPIRSFKGRGTHFFLRQLGEVRQVVCASAGNFGQGVAHAGRALGVDVRVFCAEHANPNKVARMRALGAVVTLTGADFDEAKEAAREYASEHPDSVFVEDGREPAIAEGAGSIAVELFDPARGAEPLDAVVIPLGNGALAAGMARWIKEVSPATRVVGACASGAPAMELSWRAGAPVRTERADTIADGIDVRVPVPAAVEWIRGLVDDVVLVDDDEMLDMVRVVRDSLGLLVEPAAVSGLAAIGRHRVPGDRVATVLTGGNVAQRVLARLG